MSNNEKETEKLVTKYDRKMQRRKEQEAKEKKEKKINTIIGIVVVAALVCLVASFPIRTYLAVNETYVSINDKDVTKVEFDYNYNLAKTSYLAQYGTYLSYFGVDMNGDLSTQMYSDTLSWEDFFEQMTVDNLIKNEALLAEAEAAGFTYDTSADYAEYETVVKEQAADTGVTVKEYLQTAYGPYATMNRLSDYVKEAMYINAFYAQKTEENEPAADAVQAYYEENTAEYDSVDYRVTLVEAELPTEPTELADPVETPAEGTEADKAETDTTETEETYQPSEAEIAEAMKAAKAKADEAVKTVEKDGELQENITKAEAASVVKEWLFEDARKAGDTTVIEDTNNNRYYVLAFENRYLDETPSVNVRVIRSQEVEGQTILDEWTSGEATEESFKALYEKYSEDAADTTAEDGSLYEAIVPSAMEAVLGDWLGAPERAYGDTTAVTSEDGYNYVMFYVGQNDPEWKLSIRSTLLTNAMTEYLEQISEGYEVQDPKGNLNYLKVQEEAANTEAEASVETEASGEAETSVETEATAETTEATESTAK